MIGYGWVAAADNAIVGALFGDGDKLSYLIAAIFFLLAIGIYRRIDWCAVTALVLFAALRIQFYYEGAVAIQHASNGQVILGLLWGSAVLFTQLYVFGVIGTLLWNARHSEMRYSLASLFRRGESGVNPAAERGHQ